MSTMDANPSAVAANDELDELELRVARRADELARQDDGHRPGRDYWQQAEREIWTSRLGAVEAAPGVPHQRV